MKTQWQVFAIDSYGKRLGPPTFVLASGHTAAKLAGLRAFLYLGRRARRVEATPYDPTRDFAFRGFIHVLPS